MTNFKGCNTNYECINKNPVSCFCVAYFMKFCEWDIPVVCGEVRKNTAYSTLSVSFRLHLQFFLCAGFVPKLTLHYT